MIDDVLFAPVAYTTMAGLRRECARARVVHGRPALYLAPRLHLQQVREALGTFLNEPFTRSVTEHVPAGYPLMADSARLRAAGFLLTKDGTSCVWLEVEDDSDYALASLMELFSFADGAHPVGEEYLLMDALLTSERPLDPDPILARCIGFDLDWLACNREKLMATASSRIFASGELERHAYDPVLLVPIARDVEAALSPASSSLVPVLGGFTGRSFNPVSFFQLVEEPDPLESVVFVGHPAIGTLQLRAAMGGREMFGTETFGPAGRLSVAVAAEKAVLTPQSYEFDPYGSLSMGEDGLISVEGDIWDVSKLVNPWTEKTFWVMQLSFSTGLDDGTRYCDLVVADLELPDGHVPREHDRVRATGIGIGHGYLSQRTY